MVGLGAVAAVTAVQRPLRSPDGPDRPDDEREVPAGAEGPTLAFSTGAGQQEGAGSAPPQILESSGGSAQKNKPNSLLDFLWVYQKPVYVFYQDVHVQIFVATLIGANFLTNVVQMQVDPGNDNNPVFNGLEWFYNVVFAIELSVNMYSTWFFAFWRSGWNRFDFVVVAIGLLDGANVPLPGPLTLLRMMRAFRVFRLFKKVKNLNKIIVALQNAVPGVANAFLIMMIVMAIYAILAVEFYQWAGRGCHDNDDDRKKFMTGRGGCIGEEYFGNFLCSLYTLFQVLTGDSWSEAIARRLMHSPEAHPLVTGFFFVSFVLINAIVLINVVVAVLLEKMVTPPEDEEECALEGAGGDGQESAEARSGPTSSSSAIVSSNVVSLLSDVGTLRSDIRLIQGEVETVTAELHQSLDQTQDNLVVMKEQLDLILAAVQQVVARCDTCSL